MSHELKQLSFKLEKIIEIQKHAGKIQKYIQFSISYSKINKLKGLLIRLYRGQKKKQELINIEPTSFPESRVTNLALFMCFFVGKQKKGLYLVKTTGLFINDSLRKRFK